MNTNTIYIKIFALLMFSSTVSFAQDNDKEDEILITDQDKFITLSQLNAVTSQDTRSLPSVAERGNSVFIQQIGTNNVVISNVVSQSSDIKIFQDGTENNVEINETAREIDKLITQTGNNNSVVDFSFNPNISTNLELIQEGNNLIFERFGTNELSKNLKFKMTGDARTIVIRSF
ncbi:hypothetical protein [Aquimarina sp. AU474]|uniref:hypothetical protein n=1 Tax=Aquimarina sp. AU474 TaxID=2108529 RepID=UPI000D69B69A|nr:hypothetical protein [Aquimarina sp. AU474]